MSNRQRMKTMFEELEPKPVEKPISQPLEPILPSKSLIEQIKESGLTKYLWYLPLTLIVGLSPLFFIKLFANQNRQLVETQSVYSNPFSQQYPLETEAPFVVAETPIRLSSESGLAPTIPQTYNLPSLDSIIYSTYNPTSLYSIMPDGSGRKNLSYLEMSTEKEFDSFVLSSDRTKLVLQDRYSVSGENPNIYLSDLITGKTTQIDGGYNPVISPDSSRIAYLKQLYENETSIFILNEDGTKERYHTFTQEFDKLGLYGWSQDGSFLMQIDCDLVFFSKEGSSTILMHSDPQGTPCEPWIHKARLSQDEKLVAYHEGGGLDTIHIMRSDGSTELKSINQFDVHEAVGVESYSLQEFSFSPDSRKIGFPCELGFCIYDIYNHSWSTISYDKLGGDIHAMSW